MSISCSASSMKGRVDERHVIGDERSQVVKPVLAVKVCAAIRLAASVTSRFGAAAFGKK